MSSRFLPSTVHDQLARVLHRSDWRTFLNIRYRYGQEGDVFVIEDLDLEKAQLGELPSDFLCFRRCNLNDASFRGKQFWPMALWDCSARGLDLTQTEGMLFAYGCDLRDVRFDASTDLFPRSRTNLPSAFMACRLDESFAAFLRVQQVKFTFETLAHIPSYAFGITREGEHRFPNVEPINPWWEDATGA